MFTNSSVEKTTPRCGQKIACSDNHGQHIWQKEKEYSQIGQDFKNVISNVFLFLASIVDVYWRKTGQ